MGRTRSTKYGMWIIGYTPACWDIKQHDDPTVENLTRYVMAYAQSLESGGANDHTSRSLGQTPTLTGP
jgi:hypothetical protein